jgi:SAM-dependent methyltransferase
MMGAKHFVKRLLKPERYRQLRQALGKERIQWARVVMDRETLSLVSALPYGELDALEISGDGWSKFGFHSYKQLNYPEYDICSGPAGEGICDLVIFEQVLEHVRRPATAVQNALTMLRPGGRTLITTPFLVKFHAYPGVYGDYHRWTEDGMRTFLEDAGFVNVVTGSWGNRQCLRADLMHGLRWTDYNPLFHSLKNEPEWPISVWAMAQKR